MLRQQEAALHSPWGRGHRGILGVQQNRRDPVGGNRSFSLKGFWLQSLTIGNEGGQILTAGPAGPALPSAPRAPAGPAGPGRPLSPALPRAPCRCTGEERERSRLQSVGGTVRVPDERLLGCLRFNAAAEWDTYSQARTSRSTMGTGLSLQGHTGFTHPQEQAGKICWEAVEWILTLSPEAPGSPLRPSRPV